MTESSPSLQELIESARASERAGAWDEALSRYESAFSRFPVEGSVGQCIEVLRWIGTVHRLRGDFGLASELYDASLTIAERNRSAVGAAHALNCLAVVEQELGHTEAAEALYERASTRAEETADERLVTMVHQNLGTLANIKGDVALALERYQAALRSARRLGDLPTVILVLNNIGMAHVDVGSWEEAERHYDEAVALAQEEADAGLLALIDLNRTELYLKWGKLDRAAESCDRAFEAYTAAGSTISVAEVHKLRGMLFRETGDLRAAEHHLGTAVALARQCEARLLEAESESEHAKVHLAAGRNPEALRCLNRAHRLFREMRAQRDTADIDGHLDDLEGTFLRVTRTWAESIESKDRYTAGHCQRVADYACMLAEAVGIHDRELTWFRMGAFLHDVGKVQVPIEILNKAGKLEPAEWVAMKRHTEVGDEIIAGLDFPFDIRPMVRSHHEHWVGTGYPDGLAGETIPLHARILCLADVFDALTSDRSYRPAVLRDDALRIMEQDAGRIFDPALFPIFRRLVERPPPAPGAVASFP
jgi:putative nucleotidyltransferase with HDIG domain